MVAPHGELDEHAALATPLPPFSGSEAQAGEVFRFALVGG